MKKTLLLFVFFCFYFNAFSQGVYLKAGLTLSNLNYFGQQSNGNQKLNAGFQFGAIYEIQIDTNIFFETGLLLDSKGNIITSSWNHDPNLNSKLELVFIEIPLQLKMKFPLNSINLSVALGPTIGYGLFGYESISGSLFYPDTKNFDCFSKSGFYSRFYGGLLLTVGIELKRISMGIQYNFGLSPLFKNENALYLSPQSFNLILGYKL